MPHRSEVLESCMEIQREMNRCCDELLRQVITVESFEVVVNMIEINQATVKAHIQAEIEQLRQMETIASRFVDCLEGTSRLPFDQAYERVCVMDPDAQRQYWPTLAAAREILEWTDTVYFDGDFLVINNAKESISND